MISLIIKGTPHDGEVALKARKIQQGSAFGVNLFGGDVQCWVYDDALPAVMAWYNEDAECVQGSGFPAGTLLVFSQRKQG